MGQNHRSCPRALPPWLTKVWKRAWKWRCLIVAGLIVFFVTGWWPEITAWLRRLFPGKTKWDYIETFVTPMALAVGIFVLEWNSRNREKRKEDIKERGQMLQTFFDQVSAIYSTSGANKLAGDHNSNDPRARSASGAIRSKTLAILKDFSNDTDKKSAVVRHLADAGILVNLRVSLADADLRGVNLKGIDLRDVDFNGADISNADLSYADLRGAAFGGTKLCSTNLSWSLLSSARLFGAELHKAKLYGADLSFAELDMADFCKIEWDNNTVFTDTAQLAQTHNIPDALKRQFEL
jgi:hypothetical protein